MTPQSPRSLRERSFPEGRTIPRSWQHPGFRTLARSWLSERLGEAGRAWSGELEEVRVRPWSAVYRVTGSFGSAYFKALCPASSYEPGLVAELAERWPTATAPLLAIDPGRGWMLTDDGGPTLRERLGRRPFEPWLEILPAYAELQRASATWLDPLFTRGVPDRRLHRVPALFEAVTDAWGCTQELESDGVLSRLRDACTDLADLACLSSLHHGDLHDANVLIEEGTSGYRLFDWGDSSITHPFLSLLVLIQDPALEASARTRLIDAYLEPWQLRLPSSERQRVLACMRHVGAAVRCVEWHGALDGVSKQERDPWLPNVHGWMERAISGG